MHTTRLFTVSQDALCRGVYLTMHWGRGVYPTMHWAGGVSAHGRGLPGESARGWVSPRGDVCLPGGVCPAGVCLGVYVSTQRGFSAQGGCLPKGVWQTAPDQRQTYPSCEQNDWQTGVKTLPCRNFVASGKYRSLVEGLAFLSALYPGSTLKLVDIRYKKASEPRKCHCARMVSTSLIRMF